MPDSYNYIAYGSREYVEETPDPISMPRGRMFEYTPSDIARVVGDLGEDVLTYLSLLPAFLCSEISRLEGPQASLLVKFGRVGETSLDSREVTTRFTTLINFGELVFDSFGEAEQFFGLDPWQGYRTHWAVREGNANDLLRRIADRWPEFAGAVADAIGDAPAAAAPEEKDRVRLGPVDSVEDFLAMLWDRDAPSATETFFRGHENAAFDLTPSLLRKHESGAWQYLPNEDRLCKELLIAYHEEFQEDRFRFDELVRMQHYGLPTRLLDITSNPLVALYFACAPNVETNETEGEVVVFRVNEDRIKYYDSDTVSCLSNLSKLSHEQKNSLELRLSVDKFNATPEAGKLLHHIRSEKGYFSPHIRPEDLGSVLCVKAKRTNDRIKSQAGAFLLFGQDAHLPEMGQDGIQIERIGVRNKSRILEQLDRININATTVYPSIDRTAVHLKARYRMMTEPSEAVVE